MAAVLLAVLLLISLAAFSYYNTAVQETAAASNYASELNGTLNRFNTLGENYRMLLSDYNASITLLVKAVSNLNTSSPAYLNASKQLAPLWSDYLALARSRNVTIATFDTHLKVQYGNGSATWYNSTKVQPGWNLFQTTLVALDGRVTSSWYPQFQEHLVLAVNGVAGDSAHGWFVWEYHGSWAELQNGADAAPVYNGTIFAWTYCGFDQNYNPTCSP